MPVPSSCEKKESDSKDPEIKIMIQINDATGSGRIVKCGTLLRGSKFISKIKNIKKIKQN